MSNISSSNSQGVRVPKLRFPGFEGEWEEKSLSDVATGFDYGMNAAAGAFDGLNKYIRITDIDEKSRCYIDENPVSPKGELDDKYLVLENDILFARTGASTGKTYLYKKSDGKLYFAGFLIRISVNCDNNSTFVYNATLTDRYNRWVRLTSMRSGQPGINSQEYSSYKTYYPLLPEQNKIASFLKKLDQRIEKQHQLVELLKSYKRGALSKLFPKNGENTPEYRFAGFTKPWELCKIKDLFKITRGYVLSASMTTDIQTEDMPYPVYSSQTKNNGLMGYYSQYLYENAITWTTDGANAGTVNFRDGKFYCTNVCGVLLADSVVPDQMISEALNSVAKNHVSYVGNPKLMNNVMAEITLTLPESEKERQVISALLSYYDNLISSHKQKLDELQSLKSGLLQQLFI